MVPAAPTTACVCACGHLFLWGECVPEAPPDVRGCAAGGSAGRLFPSPSLCVIPLSFLSAAQLSQASLALVLFLYYSYRHLQWFVEPCCPLRLCAPVATPARMCMGTTEGIAGVAMGLQLWRGAVSWSCTCGHGVAAALAFLPPPPAPNHASEGKGHACVACCGRWARWVLWFWVFLYRR